MVKKVESIIGGIKDSYAAGEEDEALEPIVLLDAEKKPAGRIKNGDYVIFYDIRGEREIELTESFTDKGFSHFKTADDFKVNFVTMIEYDAKLDVRVAFPPEGTIRDTLSEVISKSNLRQVKISESEKAIHVSYFFNGKVREPFPGEDRIAVPSPEAESYDRVPQMNAAGVAEAVIEKIKDGQYRFLLANFANIDVVGHIENEKAAKAAVASVDKHMGMVLEAAKKAGVTVVITADHGTVEKWLYPEGTVDTGHTNSPVPFILVDPEAGNIQLKERGELHDIAPTILGLLNLERPVSMTGKNLIEECPSRERKVLLLILDGWGINHNDEGNLIAGAETPVMDELEKNYPHMVLRAAGEAVGMPAGTVGNSEAGHLHLGAGRRIFADRVKIDRAIEDGTFYENGAFLGAVRGAKRDGTALHLLGIVSFYSSHGSIRHLFALLEIARREGLEEVYIHAMLGRRGEQPESGLKYMEKVEDEAKRLGVGKVVSVIGRFWSLDREENWDRIEKTYRMLVYG